MRLTLALLFVPAAAAANPIEVGGALGGHAFSGDTELGADDAMGQPGPADAALLGVRAAYAITDRIAVEGEAVVIPTEDDTLHDAATVYGLRAHARFDLLTGKLRPFVAFGLGVHVLRTSSAAMDDDADQSFHWGAGARYMLSPKLDLRLDLRDLIVPDRSKNGATQDVEVTLGVAYRLGVKDRPVYRPLPPPAPMIGDQDRDGLLDNVDQCPTQPEDRDDFEDSDGCPDADNDRDGIVDAQDRCPLVAETRNGWQDDDGCADEVIRELAGIAFELDSAKIDSASAPILDRAFQILRDNPSLYIEIAGHTSADGVADKNLGLSLRRAQAVKDWLVKRGIAAQRILTVGHGSDVPIADNKTDEGRKKNRRIEFRILRPQEIPQ